MAIISLIVAASENNAIGRKGELLWNLPDDTKFFKNTTWALPVVMGRKTFESLGKPLQGRANIVITTNPEWKAEGVITAANLRDALEAAKELRTHEIFVIGGGQIYKEAILIADRIYMTRVHATFDNADAFFPVIDPLEWDIVFRRDRETDAKHAFSFSFETWEHKPK